MNREEKIKDRTLDMLRNVASIEVRVKAPLPPGIPHDLAERFAAHWQRTRLHQIVHFDQDFSTAGLMTDDRTSPIAEVASLNAHGYVHATLCSWIVQSGWVDVPPGPDHFALFALSMSACTELLLVTRSPYPGGRTAEAAQDGLAADGGEMEGSA